MRPQAPQTSFFVKRGNQSAWGPGVISNVFFGTLMVFMGVATLWQGYYFWKINHARGVELETGAAGDDQGDISNQDDQDGRCPWIAMASFESSEATQSSPIPPASQPASQTAAVQRRPGESFHQSEAQRAHVLPGALNICETMHAEPPEDLEGVTGDILGSSGGGSRQDTGLTLVETAEGGDGDDKAKGTRDEAV